MFASRFRLSYIGGIGAEMISEWHRRGGETYELVEPAIGFHPNQRAHRLLASIMWDRLSEEDRGPINPHNEQIKKRFGKQGGY